MSGSYVVEASAGTGKTTQLVQRIAGVIAAGADVERIAAVTFTVAAAGEMKLRVSQKLEAAGEVAAVRRLERAFIGTIHAFCANMLRQRPVEACVDPAFEELAEPERVFARVFNGWLQERLAAGSPVLRRAFARLAWRDDRKGGVSPAQALQDCAWNLMQWRDHPGAWSRREFDRTAELQRLLNMAETIAGLRDRCDRPGRDILHRDLQPLADFVERVRLARDLGEPDLDTWEAELLYLPKTLRFLKQGFGRFSESTTREQVWSAWENFLAAVESFRTHADASLAVDLRDELWSLVPRYEDVKQRAGQLDFLDLLVKARDLLDRPGMIDYFQRRYEFLFVDEFQDTDPLQIEIIEKLASNRDGRLYVVGDPKQSIYRFRRADVTNFEGSCERFIQAGATRQQLQISHRSVAPIQQFVNAAFSDIPGYLPLIGGRDPLPKQPSVLALPIPEPYGKRNIAKAAINKNSPVTVAAFLAWLVQSSGWKTTDPKTSESRPIEARDVCILFRRFTNDGKDLTQDYVRCLEAQGLPHVLVGSKSFHHREEIASIRTALRAIEWPDDELSVYATVRNFWGVLDGTLFLFKHKYGALYPFKHLPDEELEPEFEGIRDALGKLAALHRSRNERPIADTIHLLLEHVRAFTAFALRKGGRRVVANAQRLIESARSYELRQATSFRSFVLYLEEQSERGEASDAPILEQDTDGVKIMTVHKAKGLEFPVVILADLTAHLTGEGDRYVDPARKLCAQRMLRCAPWDLLDNLDTERELDRQEGIRVAYVAATRARDLLVICGVGDRLFVDEHPLFSESWLAPLYPALYPGKEDWRAPQRRVQGDSCILNPPPERPQDAFLMPGLHSGSFGACPVWWFDPARLDPKESADSGLDDIAVLTGPGKDGFEQYQTWLAQRQSRIEAATQPMFRLSLASESAAELTDVEVIRIAPQSAARGSRRFGKVVHGILQYASTQSDMVALSISQAREHGATEDERQDAIKRAAAVLGHALLLECMQCSRVHRELPVIVRQPDGSLVEGRADLAFCDGSRWTVVDFKTGAADNRDRGQIKLYATALEQATGLPVRPVILEI